MKRMTGKMESQKPLTLYERQKEFQSYIEKTEPKDDPKRFQYHVTALQEEVGELLKADKRWKTHRNEAFDPDEKLSEMADVFITVMNLSLWSGYSHEVLMDAVSKKINENNERIGLK